MARLHHTQCIKNSHAHQPHVLIRVGQDILGALQQVVTEKQASQRVLDTSTHLHQIFQDVFTGKFVRLDVHSAHGDEQISLEKERVSVLEIRSNSNTGYPILSFG